jgi:type-IV secretion system protein TraC
MILWDGSVSAAVELLPLDIECFDEIRINQLTEQLRSFVNSLSEGLTAQFIVKVESDFDEILERHRGLVTTGNSFLRRLDEQRVAGIKTEINAEIVFRPRLFLFLKSEPAVKPKAFSLGSLQKFSKDFEASFDDLMETVSQSIEGAESTLASLGFSVRRLSREDLVTLAYQHINPRRARGLAGPTIVPRDSSLENESPRSQISLSDLLLDQEEFVLDQERVRVLSLKTLPEMTFAGMMSGFLALPFKYELIFAFKVPDQLKEMKSLEQKRRMAHSLTANNGARVSDLEGESRLQQTTGLIREIIESGQRIFHAELILVLREENNKEGRKRLSLNTKEALSRFKTLSGAEGMQETVGAWKVFSSSLPGSPIRLVRQKKLKTNNLVDFLPVYGANIGDERPVVLTHTRMGSLSSFNPYDPKLTNYNMLVTGSSGSGKSFANNFLMLQQIARGIRVFIIDIGGSYKKLTELLGGQYFEINLSDDYAINPFELLDPSAPPTGEKVKGLVSIIEQMVVDHGERLVKLDRVQIEEILTKVFELTRAETVPRSPLISDFTKYCASCDDLGLNRIAKLLYPWVGKSPFGRLLDRPGRIKADSPIVAFDLKGLSQYPDLQSVMILILTNFIMDQIESDRTVSKRVLLDEAWELLKSPAASSFMEYAARTFRKTGSGITFITQGVEEIVQSPIGAAILNNTATKLIMLQKGDIRVLNDALKLNSQELRLIQSLEQRKGVFSEGFLMEGDARRVLRISPSPLEYWISTSDARDNMFVEKLREKLGSLEAAVVEAAKVAPFGVAMLKGGTA